MGFKVLTCLIALGLSSTALRAQEPDAAELKKRVLDKVRKKLADERAAFLKRVEKIIDEEFAKPAPGPAPAAKVEPGADPKLKEIERKLRLLEEQKETLQAELAKQKRLADDEAVRKEAAKSGPRDGQEAQQMFKEALALHEGTKFTDSIRLFKRIYYQFTDTEVGTISAYNVACGYALAGKKEEALDWLEMSVKGGYNDFDHLRKDTDLDGLRNEKRYKKLLTDR